MVGPLGRLLFIAAAAVISLHANGILQCSYNAGPLTPVAGCYSQTAFVSSPDFIDWGATTAFGDAFTTRSGSSSNAPWTAASNLGNLNATVSVFGQNGTISRTDNMTWVLDNSGNTTVLGSSINLRNFGGHFDAPPDTSTQAPTYYGDHLISITGAASGSSMLIVFSRPIDSVGLRVSAKSNNQSFQDLTIQAFNTTAPNLSSAPYLSYEVKDTGGFGTCASLQNPVISGDFDQNSTVTPCNDAPLLGIDSKSNLFTSTPLQSLPNGPWISSILISSTDPNGFFLDEMFLNDSSVVGVDTPEPGTPFLVAGGLVTAALLSRLRRKPGLGSRQ